MVKASLELPRKPVLGWVVSAGYTKKRRKLRYCKQACISSFRLFFCALRAPGRRSRPGLPQCCVVALAEGRRCAAAKRADFTIAPPQRPILPLVFSAEKTATPCAQATKAAVRGAALRGFAKQTEKDGEDHGIELARIPEILRLFHKTAATK